MLTNNSLKNEIYCIMLRTHFLRLLIKSHRKSISRKVKNGHLFEHSVKLNLNGSNAFKISEKKKLGTAGALSIIPKEDVSLPAIIMNCDILTTENFHDLLEFHEKENAKITASIRQIHHEIPYGVIEIKENKIQSLVEKPSQDYYVNAGIYVINPEIFALIPKDTFFNMTVLIDLALQTDIGVLAFPLYGYWIDIGQIQDLEKARLDSQSQDLF